jgi:hypothetical protein
MKLHTLALACTLGVLSCGKPTQVHLVAPTDAIRWTSAPSDGWNGREFDDRGWSHAHADAELPPGRAVYARRHFDAGPAFASYRLLTLDVGAAGRFVAWLNGVRMQGGDGGVATLGLENGVLRARDNLLAIEIHPSAGVASLKLQPSLSGERSARDARVTEGPYLLLPTPDGISVAWETAAAVPSTLVVDGHRFDGGHAAHHVVRVGGLLPSTSHRYHVESAGWSTEEAELRTAPASAERLRFVVYGDNRSNGDAHRRVVEAIAGESPDFLLSTGDLVTSSRQAEWHAFFDVEYALLLTTPLYPALGNHETYARGERFESLFPLGDPKQFDGRVYSMDYGPVHVAVLDSNGDLAAQARWLDADLTAAAQRGARHTFVMMHWGPFCSRHAMRHGGNPAAQSFIVPVARKHHVEAIFAGHDHLYERGAADGLPYFVSGGGGAPLTK